MVVMVITKLKVILLVSRETLLGQMSVYIKQLRDDFIHRTGPTGKGVPKGKNLPETVNNIVFVRQLEAKVNRHSSCN